MANRTYRLQLHTGPTQVKHFSRIVKRAGLKVASTGTEHLYVDVRGISCNDAERKMQTSLVKKHKKGFGLRVRQCQIRPKRS